MASFAAPAHSCCSLRSAAGARSTRGPVSTCSSAAGIRRASASRSLRSCEPTFRLRNFQLLLIRHGGLDSRPCPRPSPQIARPLPLIAPAPARDAADRLRAAQPDRRDVPGARRPGAARAARADRRPRAALRLPPPGRPPLQPVADLEASRHAPPRRSRHARAARAPGSTTRSRRRRSQIARDFLDQLERSLHTPHEADYCPPRASVAEDAGRSRRRSRPRRSARSRSSSPVRARSWSTRRPAPSGTSASP